MEKVYVQRNAKGKVTGYAGAPVPGVATEELPENHADIAEFEAAKQEAFQTGQPMYASEPADFFLNSHQFANFKDQAGITPGAWNAALDTAFPDQNERNQARNYYDKGQSFKYDHPTMVAVLTATGIAQATLDAAWLKAKDT